MPFNYYQAMELEGPDGMPTGRWVYTRRTGVQVVPYGYCADECKGHPSIEDAREHYRQWLVDTATYSTGGTAERNCLICHDTTQAYASTGPGGRFVVALCLNHLGKDWLIQVLMIRDCVSSF